MNNFHKAPGSVRVSPEKKLSSDTVAKVFASLLAGGGAYTALEHHDKTTNAYLEQVENTNSNSGIVEPVVIGDEKISFNFDGKPKTPMSLGYKEQFDSWRDENWIRNIYDADLSDVETASRILEGFENSRAKYTFGEKVSPAFLLAVELAQARLDEAKIEESLAKVVDESDEKIALERELYSIQEKIQEITVRSKILSSGTSANIEHVQSSDTEKSTEMDIPAEDVDAIADENDRMPLSESSVVLQAEINELLRKTYELMTDVQLNDELADLLRESEGINISKEKLAEMQNRFDLLNAEVEFRKAG